MRVLHANRVKKAMKSEARRVERIRKILRARRVSRAARMSKKEVGEELVRLWEAVTDEALNTARENKLLKEELAKAKKHNEDLKDELHELWAAHNRVQNEVFEIRRMMRRQAPPTNIFGPP
jgi:chromosome segregation ATPase